MTFGVTAIGVTATMAGEAEHRIAVAAHEATVVEDIVKAACMMHMQADADRHKAMIVRDTEEFDRVMQGLQYGDPDLGLSKETSGKVIDALRKMKADWLPFRDRAEAALAADVPSKDLVAWLGENDLKLLQDVEDLVAELEKVYQDDSSPLHMLIATKLAERQATIAQRIAKESCFVTAGIAVEKMRAKQAEMIGIFENTLTALRDGMPMLGIQKPTNPAIVERWNTVADRWARLRATIEPVQAGGALDIQGLVVMSQQTTELVKAIEATVDLYEGI
ncbi:MAG: type IV pili methyl-accepting chemotaxis transducer N-terminal domain-containing protein [Pseudomonadota bacterium]